MKNIKLIIVFIFFGAISQPGCKKDKKDAEKPSGILFSPVKPYQEALPGAIINFQVAVRVPAVVTSLGIRFLYPGTSSYIELPQYPDRNVSAGLTKAYQDFEFALPPATTAINNELKIKFIASTAERTYEANYTVRMKTTGLQALRLYNPSAATYYKFPGLNLLNSSGVPVQAPALTKDLIAETINIAYGGNDYPVIAGFKSGNDTRFRLATAAQYNAAPPYQNAYNSIAVANEFSILTVSPPAPLPAGTGVLSSGSYYIARVNRNGVFNYVAIRITKIPSATLSTSGPVPVQLPGNDVLDIEIKR